MVSMLSERAIVIALALPLPPLLKLSSMRPFTFAISLGSSKTVGNVLVLLSMVGAAAVKLRIKNCGVPSNARPVRAAVDFPVFLGPTAIGVGHMPYSREISS